MHNFRFLLFGLFCLANSSFAYGEETSQAPPIKFGLTLSGGGIRAASFSYGVMRGLEDIKVCAYIRNSQILKFSREKEHTCEEEFSSVNLLSIINYLSAVSGGSITASYYMTHDDDEFREEFSDILQNLWVTWDIVKNMETRFHFGDSGLFERLPLSFSLFVASAIDTAKNIAFSPFEWIFRTIDYELPFINSDLTPPVFLAASRGLISTERWQETYEDWIFDGDDLKFGDILEKRKSVNFLIHATDIKNRRPFTFNEWTFNCLGISQEGYLNFPIALAAAASSALPVLYEPLHLNKYLNDNFNEYKRVDNIPSNCPRIIQDITEGRTLELLDGGIQENLGLGGLIREIFREKAETPNSKDFQSVKAKNFVIIVNSAARAVDPFFSLGTDSSTMVNNIDQSLDTLQREKTDLARTIYQKPLNNFGFGSMEINFSDITNDSKLIRQIWEEINKNKITPDKFNETLNYVDSYSEFEQNFRKDLEQIGMRPTMNDIDTLIAAGRSIILHKSGELIDRLVNFSKREFKEKCEDINNPTKYYCWPKSFQSVPYILDKPLGPILKVFSDTTESFIKGTTIKRRDRLEEIQRKGMRLKNELEISEKSHKIKILISNFIRKEIDYYNLVVSFYKSETAQGIVDSLKKLHSLFDEKDNEKEAQLFNQQFLDAKAKLNNHESEEIIYLKGQILPAVTILRDPEVRDLALKDCVHYQVKADSYDEMANSREKEIYCYTAENLMKEINERRKRGDLESKNSITYFYSAILADFLDRNVFYNLFNGLHAFPNSEILNAQLGHMNILLEGNADGAIRHYSRAINIVEDKLRRLEIFQSLTHNTAQLEKIGELRELYKIRKNWYKRQAADFLALIPGYYETFHFKKNGNHKKIGAIFANEIHDEFGELAKKIHLNENKEGIQEPAPGLMHHEILYPLALHKIVNFAELECPEREEEIQKSKNLLIESVGFLLKALEIMVQKSSIFHDQEKDDFHHTVKPLLQDPLKIDKVPYERLLGSIFPFKDSKALWNYLKVDLKQKLGSVDGEKNWDPFLAEIKQEEDIFNVIQKLPRGEDRDKISNWVNSWFALKDETRWVNRVAEKIKTPTNEGELKDIITLLFDLKYLRFFLNYANELECLGGIGFQPVVSS